MMAGRPWVIAPPDEERLLRCTRCSRWIELCAFCERGDCGHVICYRCLREALEESLTVPHPHGG